MPTWETATDWDNAQSETGAHHEQPTGTQWASASTLEKGWPGSDWSNWGVPAPTAYWPLEETSGTTANDVTGNGHDLQYGNVTQSGVTGPWSNGIPHFPDATDQAIDDSFTPTFSTSTSLSGVAWIRMGSNTNTDFNNYIFSNEDTSTSDGFNFEVESTGAIMVVTQGSNTGSTAETSGTAVNDDTLHLVGASWDQSNAVVTVYVDGSQDYQVTGYSDTSSTSSPHLAIGDDATALGDKPFGEGHSNDAIGHVAYWIGHELTATQHQELYEAAI